MFCSKMMTVLMLVLAGGLFAACKTGTATPPTQIFMTDAYQPLNLNARRLEIIDNWQMPVADPYIGHLDKNNTRELVIHSGFESN